MVVADQTSWQADVVVVIEGTANLSPYFESLKTNYIIPTLEYFNGGPADDRDYGCDTSCTMYALVVFMAADCAPETAATVFGPTPSTHKFLSWLEKIKFIGGAGESHSHVAEGLSTALQVFDDFHGIRDTNITTQKHCILICNSPPYPLPALESSAYSGLTTEQLAGMMAERHINLSILSLRKIPALFKIYEKAGGDMPQSNTKNYAKDSRHCILLRGYQLQERPISPPSLDNSKPSTASVCSPPATGQKRPATNSPPHPREATGFKQPATQSNYTGLEWPSTESQSTTMTTQNPVPSTLPTPGAGQSPLGYGQAPIPAQPNQPLTQRPGIPAPSSHLNSMNQPNPPNVTITNKGPPQHSDGIRPQRGHSPVPNCGSRMTWNQTAPSPPNPTPPTTSVLATQLNMGPGNVPMRLNAPQIPLNQTVSNIVSQAQQSTMSGNQNVLNAANIRGNLTNLGLRMQTTPSGPVPIGGNNTLAAQLGQHQGFGQNSQAQLQQAVSMANAMPTIQSKLGTTSTGSQQLISPQGQTMTTTATSNMPLQSVPGILPMAQGNSQQGQQQTTNSMVNTKDRRTIWQGFLEFQEKGNPPQVQGQRVTHTLACTFSSVVTNNGESDVNAEKWPNRLMLQLIPRQLIVAANLFAILKTAAKHVLIHFTQDCEALNKLCKNMSSGLVGCVQFPSNCDIRIMVVLYMPDKRIYMGFIANDQEAFFNNIRQMYDSHRKQQQQKQRMLAGGVQPPDSSMPIQPSSNVNPNVMMPQPSATNINPNNSQISTRMPLNQQVPQSNAPPSQQAPANNSGMVHSSNINAQNNAARLNHLEGARQQNLYSKLTEPFIEEYGKNLDDWSVISRYQTLSEPIIYKRSEGLDWDMLKIQQLQQTLEAAQQKELQFKAAHEQQQQVQQQQQQQQQQQMLERQNAIRQLQQQLQHQQQQLARQQQSINMQQLSQQQSSHNPQLRNLLQQQQQVQQLQRQQIQQNPMLMQHPQGMRPQIPGNIAQGGISSTIGQPQQQQAPQQNQQQAWGDLGMLDSLQP